MKIITLTLLATITLCIGACKKKDNDINFRNKYAGIYTIDIHSDGVDGYGTYPVMHDTSYTLEIIVRYAPGDSVVIDSKLNKMPAISFVDLTTGILFRQLGVDINGQVYCEYGFKNKISGGFIPPDNLINIVMEGGTNHSSYKETINGHKI